MGKVLEYLMDGMFICIVVVIISALLKMSYMVITY